MPQTSSREESAKSTSSKPLTNRADQLAEKINDEFLTCKICLDNFKRPKSLTCLHAFCEDCIEQHANSESSYKKYSEYREFTCPLCRKRTQLPPGGVKNLPDNFLLSSLNEIVKRQKPSKMPYCDICKMVSKRQREATAKCLDCSKLLCMSCVEQHRDMKITKNHSVFDIEIEKDIECKEHSDEVVRFYCEPCELCVCVLCTFMDHKGHEISQFSEAVGRYKANVETLLTACKLKLEKYEQQMETIRKCSNVTKQAEQKVKDVALEMIGQIRIKEKQLLEEIQTLYGKDTTALIERRSDLQSTLEGLKSTCALTELILNGKGIELLLLKKDVSEKLATLSKDVLDQLPATICKTVKFVPGMVDLGYIHDMDRPLLSKQRYRRALTSSFDYRSPTEDFAIPWFSGATVNEVFHHGNDTSRSVETQTIPSDRSDVGLMTEHSFKRYESLTREQFVQVNERDLPSSYSTSGDVPTAVRNDFSAATSADEDGTNYGRIGASTDASDSGALRRRRRRERTQTTNIEKIERKYSGEATETDGDADDRGFKRTDGARSSRQRFHLLDAARLRRHKSFDDDGLGLAAAPT